MDSADATRHGLAPPPVTGLAVAVAAIGGAVVEGNAPFGVADVVEMDAVDVITPGDVGAQGAEIFGHTGQAGIHVPLVARAAAQLRPTPRQGRAPQPAECGVAPQGKGHDPSVQLHAPAVALVNGQGEGIIVGRKARCPGEDTVPRLERRGVGRRGPDARLEKHRVDTGSTEAVERLAERLALARKALGRRSGTARPVETAQCGEPDRPDLAWRQGCKRGGHTYNI